MANPENFRALPLPDQQLQALNINPKIARQKKRAKFVPPSMFRLFDIFCLIFIKVA